MHKRIVTAIATAILILPLGGGVQAAQESAVSPPRPELERVPLVEVLEAARRNSDRTFLLDHRVHPTVVLGQARIRDVDYPTLLAILRNNDLAAVNADGVVYIVPSGIVRQFPLPVLHEADDSIHDEEWVTWILQMRNASPQSVVPIIRPMMPQAGHFAANPESQSVLIVDRYGNAKRIVALIRQIDAATPN